MNQFQISVEEVKKKLDKNDILLIDVREKDEHDTARIDGSLLIPLNHLLNKLNDIKKLAKGKEVVVYCHHGFRSAFAAEFLRKNGVNSRSMAGGIDEWSRKVDNKVPYY